MKISLENKLSKFQKQAIFWSAIFFIIALGAVIIKTPSKEPECLRPLFQNSISQYMVRDACLQKLIDSVILIEQLTFILKATLLAALSYLIIGVGVSLYRWTLKP